MREDYKGYTIQPANPSGGKAGKGRNKTSTIQVLQPIGVTSIMVHSERYTVASLWNKQTAVNKAKLWIDKHPLNIPAKK